MPLWVQEIFIKVRTRFVGFHRWEKAPSHVSFLRHFHRHEFHVEATKQVSSTDRQIEFITLKKQIDVYLQERYEGKEFELSCEAIAQDLLTMFNLSICEVWEDGENGGVVSNTRMYTHQEAKEM